MWSVCTLYLPTLPSMLRMYTVQIWICWSSECGPTKCSSSYHITGSYCQLLGESSWSGADSTHFTTARIIIYVFDSSSHHTGTAGTCGLQTTQGYNHTHTHTQSLSHTHTMLPPNPQYAVEVLDLVKRTLPIISVATHTVQQSDESSSNVYSDTKHLHYATVETDHPYKPSAVTHYRVSNNIRHYKLMMSFVSA